MRSPVIDLTKVRNAEMYAKKLRAWNDEKGPRIGDFIRMQDGSIRRFTYDWGDGVQTTMKDHVGSFYLGEGGGDFSGSLDSAIPKEKIIATPETKPGDFWVFDEGIPGGGRGVGLVIQCRVYEEKSESNIWNCVDCYPKLCHCEKRQV